MRRRLLYTLLALVAAALVICDGRAAADRAQPRPARRRRRAAGAAAVARRVGRARRRRADPRPRGDLLPGRDRQRDRRAWPSASGSRSRSCWSPGSRPGCSRTGSGGSPGARSPCGWRGRSGSASAEQLIDRSGAPALLLARLDPVRPVQPRRLPGGRGARARLALHVDDVRRRAADHRRRDVPGHALDDLSASDPLLWVAVGVIVLLDRADASTPRGGSSAQRADQRRRGPRPRMSSARGTVPTAGCRAAEREVLGADVLVAARERDLAASARARAWPSVPNFGASRRTG